MDDKLGSGILNNLHGVMMLTFKLQQNSDFALGSDGQQYNKYCSIYLDFIANGGMPQPADPIVITVVTMRQARLALLQAGMLTQVNTAIANMAAPDGDAARITWEFSSEVRRDNPLIGQLATALGLTSTQLDQLFTTAATL